MPLCCEDQRCWIAGRGEQIERSHKKFVEVWSGILILGKSFNELEKEHRKAYEPNIGLDYRKRFQGFSLSQYVKGSTFM